jgi:hypothetical protein
MKFSKSFKALRIPAFEPLKEIKMIIEKNDVRAFLHRARNEYEIGADTVFCEDRVVKPGDLHFCMGAYDEALFRHEHSYDLEWYTSYSVRTLYEAITLIHKKMVPPEEYIVKEPRRGRELIDLGKFIQKREVITQLHQSMKYGDWYYEYADDFQVWRKGEAYFNGIKENLQWLSHHVNGKTLANELWTMYAPPYSLRRPDFLKEDTLVATQSQQKPNGQEQISGVKPAQNRKQQSKKINRSSRHRPWL